MDDIFEILEAIQIGVVVATFLLNTRRIIKAVDILNECLVLLNGRALRTIKERTTSMSHAVHLQRFVGYSHPCNRMW